MRSENKNEQKLGVLIRDVPIILSKNDSLPILYAKKFGDVIIEPTDTTILIVISNTATVYSVINICSKGINILSKIITLYLEKL